MATQQGLKKRGIHMIDVELSIMQKVLIQNVN